MTKLKEALETLGIEEYSERILNSNSRGEMLYLQQYFSLAEIIGKTEWFPEYFKETVSLAEKEWDRPESVFQHIERMLFQTISAYKLSR